ncbi:hypothetical protein DRE_05457 [Drechslerella stenobrocha 248]|uniref:Transcriptional repressor Tup1 N-terminal domain-containing protein n=1 Tax=Drechslerella stenobrocha 248 TaxID=1043628 RepID=W7HR05_9PEZI|nr:hypothetical protein DRE_05457 [Drechslerella stenobrocha 248]
MFNAHRGHVPAILDQLRAEYDAQIQRGADSEHKVNSQLQEMEMIQRAVYSLETTHQQMKQKYDDEIARLNRELEKYTGQVPQHPGPSQPAGSSAPQQQPPQLGQGRGLFGGIMAGPGMSLADPQAQQNHQQQPQQPGVAPPSSNPHQPPQGPHGHPIHAPQPPLSQPPQGGPQPPQSNSYPPQPPSSFPGTSFNSGSNPQPPAQPSTSHTPTPGSNKEIARPPPGPKKDDSDWFVYPNPRVPHVLNVDLVHTLEHNSVVCCVRFSHDGKYLATGCNRSAQIFDVGTGQKVTILQDESAERGGDLYIRSVCFSPDGRYLATGAEDKQIRVWDIGTRKIKHLFRGHEQDIYSLDFSKNGRYIASGSGDRTVRIWDMETGSSTVTLTIEDGVTTVAISPDSKFVAAGSLDNCIRIWEISSGTLIERLEGSDRAPPPEGAEHELAHEHNEGHRDSVYSVAFTSNGAGLISGSLDKTVKMWTLASGKSQAGGLTKPEPRLKTFEGHEDFVLSVAQTPDAYGPWVISGSKDRRVQFWDPRTNQIQLMLQGHKNSVISVAPSPAGRLFATGSGDYKARIWSYERT